MVLLKHLDLLQPRAAAETEVILADLQTSRAVALCPVVALPPGTAHLAAAVSLAVVPLAAIILETKAETRKATNQGSPGARMTLRRGVTETDSTMTVTAQAVMLAIFAKR